MFFYIKTYSKLCFKFLNFLFFLLVSVTIKAMAWCHSSLQKQEEFLHRSQWKIEDQQAFFFPNLNKWNRSYKTPLITLVRLQLLYSYKGKRFWKTHHHHHHYHHNHNSLAAPLVPIVFEVVWEEEYTTSS